MTPNHLPLQLRLVLLKLAFESVPVNTITLYMTGPLYPLLSSRFGTNQCIRSYCNIPIEPCEGLVDCMHMRRVTGERGTLLTICPRPLLIIISLFTPLNSELDYNPVCPSASRSKCSEEIYHLLIACATACFPSVSFSAWPYTLLSRAHWIAQAIDSDPCHCGATKQNRQSASGCFGCFLDIEGIFTRARMYSQELGGRISSTIQVAFCADFAPA